MPYLLDTNIVSDLARNPRGVAAGRVVLHASETLFTSIIVASELRCGMARKPSHRLAAQLEIVLGGLSVIPFDTPADRAYGDLRAQLEAAGQIISANDMLIAAHALSLGYTLVTDNQREFSRVKGLAVE
ncbi:MAG TPA: type II toxin-antitoxin system VapC family toxin, partial [Micropepsaceae bacterium]|nr:type II toxin-antitoxin system VapC family toxin [Micropepsaceae bacterium]